MGAKLWGKVVYSKRAGCWAVRGTYQGKQLWFSAYQTDLGRQTCHTEVEARLLQTIISNEIAQGCFIPERYRREKPLHVAKYADGWLNQVKPTVKYSTWKAYRAAVSAIKAGLGDVFLPDLQFDSIHRWVTGMMESGASIKTAKNYHGVLAAMLADAKRARKIATVPDLVQFRGGLSIPFKDPDWLDRDQQKAILGHIRAADRWIFQFLMATGVRPSEARAIKRRDVMAGRGYIAIKRTFAPGPKGQGEILQPVKQKRERRIPITEEVAEILKTLPVNLKSEFLFNYSVTGRHYTKNINRDLWNPACEAAGIRINLYNATRHSFANQLIAAGTDLLAVSRRLGHSSVRVTEQNYLVGG